MTVIVGIDPGPEKSALVEIGPGPEDVVGRIFENECMLHLLNAYTVGDGTRVAIEDIASYGMPVGAEVFSTCVWIGRFEQRIRDQSRIVVAKIYRREVKLELCGSPRAKDGNVRQALIDLYGPGKEKAIGLKKSPGPLYGFKADMWAALGVAVTYKRMLERGEGK